LFRRFPDAVASGLSERAFPRAPAGAPAEFALVGFPSRWQL